MKEKTRPSRRPRPGSGASSSRLAAFGRLAASTITRIGSGGSGPRVWMCAFISETATRNGAPDINGDRCTADGGSMSFGDQWACAGRLRDLVDVPTLYKTAGGT
jgi:hypothetical protein